MIRDRVRTNFHMIHSSNISDSVRAFKKRLAAEKMTKEGQSASSPPDPFEQQNETLKHIQVGFYTHYM